MKKIIKTMILLFSLNLSFSQDVATFFKNTDAFLKANVANGKVDYDALKKNSNSLNELIEKVSKIDISKENTNTQKAFLINTYNILLIKGIVSKYPVKMPTEIAGLFDKTTFIINGKKYTLNDLENKLIRAKYNDPRVHFVLVCGANGCPPITNNAYLPETLEEQLNKQTKLALNNTNFIKVNTTTKKVELSQIFEWYKDDFISKGKNEIEFINQYRDTKIDAKYKVYYYPYDWTLNKK